MIKLEAYSDFAYVYDIFMDTVPYEKWKNDICVTLKEYGIEDGLILDLGCGTGTMTRLLRDEGYDMIGVDASIDMLNIARDNDPEGILYLNQDMREFELYGTIRAVVSVCDCINYLTEKADVIRTFKLVNNYLDPKGLFIFDFNTVHKYRDVIGDTTIAENRDNCSFIWENEYDQESRLNRYDVTIFVREDMLDDGAESACYISDEEDSELEAGADTELEDEEDSELEAGADAEDDDNLMFARFTETHIQRGYELEDMINMLETAGMEYVKAYDTETGKVANKDSERITVIAREKRVEGKVYN